MKQDIDISNIESKPTAPKRDRIRIERKKYDQMLFDLKIAQTALDNRNKEIDGWVKQNNELREESDRLKAEVNEVKERNNFLASWWSKHNKKAVQDLDTLARNLRDQRDMARFIATMFGLTAFGFAVSVWIGKLAPVV